jgi:hypothetical protein
MEDFFDGAAAQRGYRSKASPKSVGGEGEI